MPWRRARAAAPVRVSVLMRVLAGEGPCVRALAGVAPRPAVPRREIVAAAVPPAAAPLRALYAPAIRVVELDVDHGLAGAYERCRAQAAGEFLLLLAPGETLASSAFAKAVSALDGSEGTPVVYADEDHSTMAVRITRPFSGPTGRPSTFSRLSTSIAPSSRAGWRSTRSGASAPDYDPVPEWDLLLRLSELGRPFAHVARCSSTAPGSGGTAWRRADPALIAAGQRAVAERLPPAGNRGRGGAPGHRRDVPRAPDRASHPAGEPGRAVSRRGPSSSSGCVRSVPPPRWSRAARNRPRG